jgi:acyl-CoA synthetase (NDP forming)
VEDVPQRLDLVVICNPSAEKTPELIEACGRAGVQER